jgi:hypothetical protein
MHHYLCRWWWWRQGMSDRVGVGGVSGMDVGAMSILAAAAAAAAAAASSTASCG